MFDGSFHFILEETNDRQSPATEDDDTRAGTIESASEDVIMISSSEGNTNECNTDPGSITRISLTHSPESLILM